MDRPTIDLDNEVVEVSQNVESPSIPSAVSAPNLKRKREESVVWRYYDKKIDSATKSLRAYCKTCPKSYAIGDGGNSHGTKNLHKHCQSCPGLVNYNVGQMHLDHEGKMRSRKFSQLIYRDLMAEAIMKHNYPFLIVEHEGLQRVHTYLNENVKTYTRNTARADCIKIFKLEKEKLKSAFNGILGRICLTSDVWSSDTSEGYISLTAHFVDSDSVLHSRIINFNHFPPPHTGLLLAEKIFGFLKDWGIEKKIFSLTLDNATNNDSMINYLKAQLRGNLLCNGKFFHIRCCAHILNLIVQDGLKIASEALRKIRESVKYVKGSEGRTIKFASCCEQLNLSIASGLRLDCATRWNSTWDMLNFNLPFRDAFTQYSLVESSFKTCLSNEEWDVAQAIATFLKPFAKITHLFSGSSYPTADKYFLHVLRIQELLMKNKFSNIEVIRNMSLVMTPKFEKYWDEYSEVLSMAIILDPRYKVQFVEYRLKSVENDESVVKRKVEKIVVAMKLLFSEYVSEFSKDSSHSQVEQSTSTTTSIYQHSDDEFDVSNLLILSTLILTYS